MAKCVLGNFSTTILSGHLVLVTNATAQLSKIQRCCPISMPQALCHEKTYDSLCTVRSLSSSLEVRKHILREDDHNVVCEFFLTNGVMISRQKHCCGVFQMHLFLSREKTHLHCQYI